MTREMNDFDLNVTKIKDVTFLNGDDLFGEFELIAKAFFGFFEKKDVFFVDVNGFELMVAFDVIVMDVGVGKEDGLVCDLANFGDEIEIAVAGVYDEGFLGADDEPNDGALVI